MITIEDSAKEMVLSIFSDEGIKDGGIRVRVIGRKAKEYRHELSIVEPEDILPEDTKFVVDGLAIYVDPDSLPKIEGSSISYVDEPHGGGFKVNNPNVPSFSDSKGDQIMALFDSEINPMLASHGGFVELIDVKDSTVYLRMGGGCQGCGMADVTLRQGVERMIREAVPEIDEIIDVTDHASGANPYYQP